MYRSIYLADIKKGKPRFADDPVLIAQLQGKKDARVKIKDKKRLDKMNKEADVLHKQLMKNRKKRDRIQEDTTTDEDSQKRRKKSHRVNPSIVHICIIGLEAHLCFGFSEYLCLDIFIPFATFPTPPITIIFMVLHKNTDPEERQEISGQDEQAGGCASQAIT